jgi:YegS/Rv2252/BmrU family lipid kinase
MQAADDNRNIAIVCNSLAGNGRAVVLAERASKQLVERNVAHKIFITDWPADFDGFTNVFIAGGDGTLNYFINCYPEIKIPIVIFKGGSGNDLHWLLYGNKGFDEQLTLALSAAAKPVDVGVCNGRLFMNGVGVGFDGAVAKSLTGKKKRAGKTSFLIAILKKIFFYRSKTYTVSSGEIEKKNRQLLIGVANGRRAGGGFHITPEAEPNDGLLDVILVDAINPFKRLRWLPVIEKGKHLGLPFIQYFKTKKILIQSDSLMEAHLDGECYSDYKMEIEILPSKFLFVY